MSKYTTHYISKVDSTNSYALSQIQGFADKSVIYSFNQTSGRGRYNRKWVGDGSENLYVTFVLKPENIENYPIANLTQYLSVKVCEILEEKFNLKPCIKWPNDILVENHKISGILAESYMQNNKIIGIVLGLGLNVNLGAQTLQNIDQKATSLSVLKNQKFDVEIILNDLCEKFFAEYDLFVKNGFSYIKDDYVKRCNFLEKNISIRELNETKEYYAKAIADDGLLLVKDKFENESKIITGDLLLC